MDMSTAIEQETADMPGDSFEDEGTCCCIASSGMSVRTHGMVLRTDVAQDDAEETDEDEDADGSDDMAVFMQIYNSFFLKAAPGATGSLEVCSAACEKDSNPRW